MAERIGRDAQTVRIAVNNGSSVPVDLILEPWGDVHRLESGQHRVVRRTGDPPCEVAVDVGDGRLTIWEEGSGTLELEE